ncbi:MAG TPA: hypothetical protein VFS22_08000 [Flavisolibacter sp.]|nr:hypothetical protein [Flavisolibacter sp.]
MSKHKAFLMNEGEAIVKIEGPSAPEDEFPSPVQAAMGIVQLQTQTSHLSAKVGSFRL